LSRSNFTEAVGGAAGPFAIVIFGEADETEAVILIGARAFGVFTLLIIFDNEETSWAGSVGRS
jgi:hypothetical protein